MNVTHAILYKENVIIGTPLNNVTQGWHQCCLYWVQSFTILLFCLHTELVSNWWFRAAVYWSRFRDDHFEPPLIVWDIAMVIFLETLYIGTNISVPCQSVPVTADQFAILITGQISGRCDLYNYVKYQGLEALWDLTTKRLNSYWTGPWDPFHYSVIISSREVLKPRG